MLKETAKIAELDIRLFDMEMGLDIQFIPKLYR